MTDNRFSSRSLCLLTLVFLIILLLFLIIGNRVCRKVRQFIWSNYPASVDMLSIAGRLQAFSLGESFAEHYGSALLNLNHLYEIEYAGILSVNRLTQINIELKRLHDGLHWDFGV